MKSLVTVVGVACALAVGAVVVALTAGFGHRLQLWGYMAGFKILFAASVAGAVAAVLAIIGIYLSWRVGASVQVYWSVAALLAGSAVLVPVVSGALAVRSVPYIHDISTDTENPPVFVAILKERANAPNTAEYGGPEVAKLQHAAYPDLKPLQLAASPSKVFEAALEGVRDSGWKIVVADSAAGRIEASARTFWYGFIDDVVIRIAPAATGARVDMRSVSRVGKSDLGANARRIRKFLDGLAEKLGTSG